MLVHDQWFNGLGQCGALQGEIGLDSCGPPTPLTEIIPFSQFKLDMVYFCTCENVHCLLPLFFTYFYLCISVICSIRILQVPTL